MTPGEVCAIVIPLSGLTFGLIGAAIGYGWRTGQQAEVVRQNRQMIIDGQKLQKECMDTFQVQMRDMAIAQERNMERINLRLDVGSTAITKLEVTVSGYNERMGRVEKAINGALNERLAKLEQAVADFAAVDTAVKKLISDAKE
jgi:hypothetical protein